MIKLYSDNLYSSVISVGKLNKWNLAAGKVYFLIVSTGSIRWILWFSVRYAAAAAARREIFGVNALRGKQQQLGSPNLQDIFIGG